MAEEAILIFDFGSLFAGVPESSVVGRSQGDRVSAAGGDFIGLASTDTCPVAAARHLTRPIYGLQFHAEVSHTAFGSQVLRNFLYDICGCRGTWKMSAFIERTIADIRQHVGHKRVICALSRGVDSSVTASLLFN